MTLTLILIIGLAIWFVFLWTLVMTLLSLISGWRRFSLLYPAPVTAGDNTSLKFSMCSIRVGLISYNNIADVIFSHSGIVLKVMKIFSFMHKPIFIPYEKITDVMQGRKFFIYTSFKVDGKKIFFYGKPGEELYSRMSPVSNQA
jgi:hypothetical protein